MRRQAAIGLDRVGDVEDVAHLAAVAVDRDRLAVERADQEMRDPALVLGSHLARAVDAAHAHHAGRHAEAARVVEHVLIGGALRAAVGRVEVERAVLADALRADARIARHVGVVGLVERDVGEVAVDLVGAAKSSGTRSLRRRSASSRWSVPRTLMSKSSRGSTRLVVTATCAAKWNTACASRRIGDRALRRGCRRRRRRSAADDASSARRGCARRRRARASKTSTSWPSRARRSARFEPMKPAPPVTAPASDEGRPGP